MSRPRKSVRTDRMGRECWPIYVWPIKSVTLAAQKKIGRILGSGKRQCNSVKAVIEAILEKHCV